VRKDSNGNIIGAGEDTAVAILEELYILRKSIEVIRQKPLLDLLTDEFKDSLGDPYLKHKIDIMVIRDPEKPIVVRVQGKDHEGVLKSARDTVQKKILEWHNCIVVDLNWYDCPNLFKEELNDNSREEVKNALLSSGVHL
jgi:signal peptidase I